MEYRVCSIPSGVVANATPFANAPGREDSEKNAHVPSERPGAPCLHVSKKNAPRYVLNAPGLFSLLFLVHCKKRPAGWVEAQKVSGPPAEVSRYKPRAQHEEWPEQ